MNWKHAFGIAGTCTLLAASAHAQWSETKSSPAGLQLNDFYGTAVALSGDLAFVSAPGGATDQEVYVLQRDLGGSGNWGELARLTTGTPGTYSGLGQSLAVSGVWALVSADGSAHLFHRNQGGDDAWGEFTAFSQAASGEKFGNDLDIKGDTLVIGDPLDAFSAGTPGRAFVYGRNQGGTNNWGLLATLTASDSNPWGLFGTGVTVDGDTICVSAQNLVQGAGGAVYVFERDLGGPGAWGERKKLEHATFGGQFGEALDLRGDTLVIGDRSDSEQGTSSGAVHVLERDLGGPNNWGRVLKLAPPGHQASITFGEDVALSEDGDRIVAGAAFDSLAVPDQGSATIFDRHHGGFNAWGAVQRVSASDGQSFDRFGGAVAVSGGTILVGSNDGFGGGTGAAYFQAQDLPPQSYCTAGLSASGCAALISASGTPSASAATGFFVTGLGGEGAKDGLFFFGTSGRQANSWGNGSSFQCVVPPVQRAGLLTGVGTAGACDGFFSRDLNARWAAHPNQNPGAGGTVQVQLWYRDPASSSNQTTSLSDALEVTVGV